MATSHSLKAETRACGSGNLKQLRSQGLVPGVVYGPGFDNVNIQVDAREFARMLASAVSEHILVALDINGKIVKVRRGQYALSEGSHYLAEARKLVG